MNVMKILDLHDKIWHNVQSIGKSACGCGCNSLLFSLTHLKYFENKCFKNYFAILIFCHLVCGAFYFSFSDFKNPISCKFALQKYHISSYAFFSFPIFQRLAENTAKDHPDYLLLMQAEKVMHDMALKIGSISNSEEGQHETLKKLELLLITDVSKLVGNLKIIINILFSFSLVFFVYLTYSILFFHSANKIILLTVIIMDSG